MDASEHTAEWLFLSVIDVDVEPQAAEANSVFATPHLIIRKGEIEHLYVGDIVRKKAEIKALIVWSTPSERQPHH